MTKRLRPDQFPPWYDVQSINEAAFCREFLASHKLIYTENSFFTPEGRMTDEAPLKTEIYQIIEPYASTSVPKKILFMDAGDYIRLTPEGKVGSQELYEIYTVWCRENGFSPLRNRSFSEFLIANQKKYGIEHSNNLTNLVGRRVWGFTGIEPVLKLPLRTADGWQRDCLDDNPFI